MQLPREPLVTKFALFYSSFLFFAADVHLAFSAVVIWAPVGTSVYAFLAFFRNQCDALYRQMEVVSTDARYLNAMKVTPIHFLH